ncbi:hypothetical protein D9M72_623180 [compost metagenome]
MAAKTHAGQPSASVWSAFHPFCSYSRMSASIGCCTSCPKEHMRQTRAGFAVQEPSCFSIDGLLPVDFLQKSQ